MTAFDERLREAVAEAQRVQRASFGETALLSLAVVPLWTSDIPGPHGLHELDERVEDWVARCEAAGLCESREIIGRDGLPAVAFEMTASVRADVLAAADPLEAARVARMIGDVVYPAPAFVPRSLRRWAELAFLDPNIMGDELSKRANAAIDARDAGTALDWITVGEILTPVFGGDVGSAVARARRRLNLLYRAQQDERLLAGFVRREDQIGAVERLLSGPGDEWALHLIGLGGAGKTMLIRYIGTLLAGERRLERLVVARVDFDYIDARFPFEQPAELLVRLCDGLAMYVEDSTQEALLEAFVRAKRDADDTLGGPGGDPRQRIMDAPMQRVLDAWAEFVASLGDRVLLILDTCEELAKLHAGEEAVPSVEAMWRLMTETHRRLPHLRVLLAGRRLLAAADAEGPYDLLPGLVASFEERPYLRTFEIRGFDRVEAVQLLGGADPALADAILANARELGRSPGVRGGGAGPAPDRYNPFDLNLYAAWLRANPELTAEDVSRADTDAYVEARIIARLHDDGVDAALPAIATLGRFDLAMLETALPHGLDPGRVLAVLSEQEWVDLSGGHTPETVIVTVEPHLLPRLERFCRRRRPAELQVARTVALEALERLVRDAPLDPLGVERADLALRLAAPARAAETWARLEHRVVDDRAWEWAVGACTRLLADVEDPETGESRPRHVPLRAHLLATLISARGHRSPEPPFDPEWRQVLLAAHEHPDAHIAAWLIARASVQLGADVAKELRDDALELLDKSGRTPEFAWRREQLAATDTAAVARRLDADPDAPLHSDDRRWLTVYSTSDTTPRTVATRVLEHRVSPLAMAADWARLRDRAGDCVRAGSWLDWTPPASLPDRVDLEWLLKLGWPRESCEKVLAALARGSEPLTVDHERLASALGLALLAEGGETTALEALLDRASGEPYAPVCLAHRRVPPLFVTVARMRLRMGDPAGALDLVRDRLRRYESARSANALQAEAAAAARTELVAIARRMRMPDVAIPSGMRPDELHERLAAQLLIHGRLPASGWDIHTRWRVNLAAPDARFVRELREAAAAPVSDEVLTQDLWLDLREAWLMAPTAFAGAPVFETRDVASSKREPFLRCDHARLGLRRHAVDDARFPAATVAPARRLAELALEEGELLALRLPRLARPLLAAATTEFAYAGDRAGGLAAATALTGAKFRAGELAEGRAALELDVRPAYERIEGLPPWHELGPGGGGGFAGPWAGWLLRIHAYRHWAAGDLRSFGETPELRAPGDTSIIRPAPEARPSRRRSLLASLIAAGFLVAVMVGLSVLTHTTGTVVITGALLGAIGLVLNVVLERWGLRGRLQRLVLRVVPDTESGGFVRVIAIYGLRGPGLRLRRESAVFPVGAPGGENEAVITRFIQRRTGSGKLNPQIDLHVSPGLAPCPWERRLLAFAAERPWQAGWSPDAARMMRIDRPARNVADVVAIVAPQRWSLLATRPWIGRPTLVTGLEVGQGQRPRLAILVGAGVTTPGGPRVQLDAERLASVSESTVTAASGAAEELVDPHAVLAAQPEVVVLLGAPGLADPDSTAALRDFAALLADGPRAVLVVPALPADVAAAVLDILAAAWPLAGREPRKAVRRIRRVIYDGLAGVPAATPAATALDVTLFLAR